MVEIRRYLSSSGKDIFGNWLDQLGDIKTRAIINARISRVAAGNFGDSKYLSEGVYELRINFGPGFRVYFGKHGKQVILLLCGGNKSSQSKDVSKAIEYFKDYRKRENI